MLHTGIRAGRSTQSLRRMCSFIKLDKQLIVFFIAFLLHHLLLVCVVVLEYLVKPVVEASSSTSVL